MLDLKFIRENPDRVREGIMAKQHDIDLDELLKLDEKKRILLQDAEAKRHQKNQISDRINSLQKTGQNFKHLISQIETLNADIHHLSLELKNIEQKIHEILIMLPNLPQPTVPIGATETDNREIKTWGIITQSDFPILPHWEIGKRLGILDFEGGTALAGSFFVNFRGWGARLSRALINFMLDLHVEEHGYTEISPPFLARREMLFNTGQIPLLENDMYRIEKDELFLIPTAEVPLTNIHQNKILEVEQLPLKYTAYTPCFRREAGTHGRENRGLIRIHQFDKIELVQLVEPEKSEHAFQELLTHAERVLQLLELPYRVVQLCSGELSFASAKTCDLEVWAPGPGRYLEVSSCSTYEAFQARRANIRYRPPKGKKPRYVHTLNASGVALPRTIIAILENYQTDEGTVLVPKVLHKYLGARVIKS